jgi:Flp pilus assembly protein TadD
LIYWEQDQLDQAILELQRAAASDPKDPEAPYALGMVFLQKNDSAHAIQWLQKALALKPDYAAAREALNQATGKKVNADVCAPQR